MRIATMTNWAYGITVALTLASGMAMLMASSADNAERRAVEQRQVFDQLSEEVESGAWELSDLARLYIIQKIRMCYANTGSRRRPLPPLNTGWLNSKIMAQPLKNWRCCGRVYRLPMNSRMSSRRRWRRLPGGRKSGGKPALRRGLRTGA